MKYIILIFSILVFLGCSSSKNTTKVLFDTTEKGNFAFKMTSEETEDDKIKFNLEVTRLQESDDYFPNSEQLRLIIYNKNNDLIYSTNKGKVFMQAIGIVKPQKVGEKHTYSISWNKQRSDGKELTDKEFTAQISLQTRPIPFMFKVDFGL